MKKQSGFTLPILIGALVAIFGLIGWIWNIVKLVGMGFDPITGMAVGRVVGVFVPPVGAILGYL